MQQHKEWDDPSPEKLQRNCQSHIPSSPLEVLNLLFAVCLQHAIIYNYQLFDCSVINYIKEKVLTFIILGKKVENLNDEWKTNEKKVSIIKFVIDYSTSGIMQVQIHAF